MKLSLIRDTFTDRSTTGRLFVDGKYECFTLEDRRRPDGVKVKHATCIPPGTYRVTITPSARFKRPLPLLIDVPNFEGIRIHSGNTDKDSSGCILVGLTEGEDFIGNSRAALGPLMDKIDAALSHGERVEIEISERR